MILDILIAFAVFAEFVCGQHIEQSSEIAFILPGVDLGRGDGSLGFVDGCGKGAAFGLDIDCFRLTGLR